MLEMHLRSIYSASGPFTKNKKKLKETKDPRCIYKKELDKTCFQDAWFVGILKT